MASKPTSRKRWMKRVLQVQSQRNPEELDAVRSRVEQARQHEMCARKCKAVKGLAVRSRALAVEGLRQMAESKAPEEYMAVQDRWRSAQEVSRAHQEGKNRKLGKCRIRRRRNRSHSVSSNERDRGRPGGNRSGRAARRDASDDIASCSGSDEGVLRGASESEEDAMEEAARVVGASDVTVMANAANEGLQAPPVASAAVRGFQAHRGAPSPSSDSTQSDSDAEDSDGGIVRAVRTQQSRSAGGGVVAAVLAQLTQEPEDAAECAAKFSLYEGYASEVQNMRGTLFKLHEDSRPSLPPAIVADMDSQVSGIDSAELMRIPDRSCEWFVFHMMRQAERNNSKMAGILDGFDRKLKFLAQNDQVECPVCLDAFDTGAKVAETLGCCHKVCKECWENWSKVMRGRPFCPFCRHEEFLGAVAARVSAPTDRDIDSDFDSDSGSDSDGL